LGLIQRQGAGVKTTGKQITVPFFHLDRIVNGKLVEHWGQSDLLSLMQQVGIIPIPGPSLIVRKLYLAIASITNKRIRSRDIIDF